MLEEMVKLVNTQKVAIDHYIDTINESRLNEKEAMDEVQNAHNALVAFINKPADPPAPATV